MKKLVEQSLNYTFKWQKAENQRITLPESWDSSKTPSVIIDKMGDNIELPLTNDTFDIEHAINEWQQAFSEYGIVIDKEGKSKFELWRAMVDVAGYICHVESKRNNIRKLIQAVDAYANSHTGISDIMSHTRKPQESCLVYAKPGAGKTSLIKKIADRNKLRFIPYNITQMNRLTDILDCFDAIVTSYLQNPSEPLLVFVDEINSQLEGHCVYSMFLSPLEDGVYIRGGKSFKLPPTYWVFACTEELEQLKKQNKGSDFCSRLTRGAISLDNQTDDQSVEQKRIENIYVGVSMILSIIPDVREVSKTVLGIFATLKDARMREIRHFIETFRNVQYGRITVRNIPEFKLGNINIDVKYIADHLIIEKNSQETDTNRGMVPIISSL